MTLQGATVPFSSVLNDIGALIDSQLTMADHIIALSRSWFLGETRMRFALLGWASFPFVRTSRNQPLEYLENGLT